MGLWRQMLGKVSCKNFRKKEKRATNAGKCNVKMHKKEKKEKRGKAGEVSCKKFRQ